MPFRTSSYAYSRARIDTVTSALTIFEGGASPASWSPADLESARQKVLAIMGDLQVEEQLGQQLQKRYQTVLQSP